MTVEDTFEDDKLSTMTTDNIIRASCMSSRQQRSSKNKRKEPLNTLSSCKFVLSSNKWYQSLITEGLIECSKKLQFLKKEIRVKDQKRKEELKNHDDREREQQLYSTGDSMVRWSLRSLGYAYGEFPQIEGVLGLDRERDTYSSRRDIANRSAS
ncbi:hypothetical protein LWI28_005514 [Acer negundo]|uniref:Uncharacterized protein n=1 Tax=Acer negundo TaxID=4023 RepID=A0AAD5NVW3_ACENE|nr:hypothetical protein LWI28_005514 [Acer negundo]